MCVSPSLNIAKSVTALLTIFCHYLNVMLSLESPTMALLAGNVQNTSLVPAEKLTAESELELLMIVVLASVSGVASVTVPNPTSKFIC